MLRVEIFINEMLEDVSKAEILLSNQVVQENEQKKKKNI